MINIKAKLIAHTQPVIGFPASGPEELIAHCARVSSGKEYDDRSKDYEKLLNYCIKNKHWSIFEMANAVVEVKAPRDISRQLLRHRSFYFQEFSQRYSDDIEFCDREIRLQDKSNRQNSIEVVQGSLIVNDWSKVLNLVKTLSNNWYREYINKGASKETTRAILPEGLTMSTLYVNATIRDWFHYLEVREDPTTQKEHRFLAQEIRKELNLIVPNIIKLKES